MLADIDGDQDRVRCRPPSRANTLSIRVSTDRRDPRGRTVEFDVHDLQHRGRCLRPRSSPPTLDDGRGSRSGGLAADRRGWTRSRGDAEHGRRQRARSAVKFTTITTSMPTARYSVFAADVDGDGDTDVLSASCNDDTISWYEHDGAGAFGSPLVISTAMPNSASQSVVAADLSTATVIWMSSPASVGRRQDRLVRARRQRRQVYRGPRSSSSRTTARDGAH